MSTAVLARPELDVPQGFDSYSAECTQCGYWPCESSTMSAHALEEACATARRASAAGAAYLDARWPDWHLDINLSTLDLASPTMCVLGQMAPVRMPEAEWPFCNSWDDHDEDAERTTPAYREMLEWMGHPASPLDPRSPRWASEHGFSCDRYSTYELLTCAWQEQIAERQCST